MINDKLKYYMSSSNIWKKIGIGVGIAGGVIAGVASIPIIAGFGTVGIVGGSIAAGIQAAIGNVAAGSVFAVCTSLGMTGVFSSTAAVGAILGAGGLAAYLKGIFSAQKDSKLIHATIENKDNPDIIIKLLEIRFPPQREEIRKKYNELYKDNNFDSDILNYINYIPINSKIHVDNLLKKTSEILAQTENVRLLLGQKNLEEFCKDKFKECRDAVLIDNIINNNDNPLMIVRLLNYRNEEQRKKIDSKFREIKENQNKKLLLYLIEYMPNHPEISYLYLLLEGIK